jgi:hypothetical protein
MTSFPWVRAGLAGLGGGVAWVVGIMLVFGPAQVVLTDPALQSAKMIAAFGPGPTPPRSAGSPVPVLAGVLAIGVLWGWVYVWLARTWPGPWWRRGLRFSVVSWALMVERPPGAGAARGSRDGVLGGRCGRA